MTQNDLFEARQDRDAAIQRGVDHANEVTPSWSDMALELVKRYSRLRAEPFRCEELREWAHGQQKLPEPPTLRAWGGVIARAARSKIIRRTGYVNSICKDKKNTHMSVVSEWEAC